MAKVTNGVFGAAQGSIANLTFYVLNGQPIVRKKADYVDRPSEEQLLVRSGIKTLMAFLKTIKPFLKPGFINESRGTKLSYFNVATSYNRLHAVKVEDGQYVMDYPAVRLCQGNAVPVKDAAVEFTATGLKFSWDPEHSLDWKTQQDQVMMMAYFPGEELGIYQTSGAKRATGTDLLLLPTSLRVKTMEIYISFISDDRMQVADSVYLGRLN